MVRDFSGVDIDNPDEFQAGKLRRDGSTSSPETRSQASAPSPDGKPKQYGRVKKPSTSNGEAGRAFLLAKSNEPVMGLHDLETTLKMNANKFCTSVGTQSARDLEQVLEVERKVALAKLLNKKKTAMKQKKPQMTSKELSKMITGIA